MYFPKDRALPALFQLPSSTKVIASLKGSFLPTNLSSWVCVHPWGANGFTAAHPGFLHDLLWFPDLLSLVPLHLVPLPVKPSGIIQVESAICVLSSSYQHIYSVCLEEILRLEWIKEWVSGFWRCRFIDLNPRGSLLQVWCGTQISA